MKKLLSILFILIIFLQSIAFAENKSEEQILKSKESFNKNVEVPTRGKMMLYAQNSPEWDDMFYDKIDGEYKYFGNAGCVATAMGNAIVNLVEENELVKIKSLFAKPFSLDSKAVNIRLGKPKRHKFEVQDKDISRYFPLAIGQFCSGNNNLSIHGLRSTYYYRYLIQAFNLNSTIYSDAKEALLHLNDKSIIVTSSGGYSSPFGPIGHYFNLVAQDDEYIYAFDSYFRNKYNFDKKKIIEIIEPGLIRFKKANLEKMALNKLIVLSAKGNN